MDRWPNDEGLIDLRRGRGATVRAEAIDRARLHELADALLSEAARVGLGLADIHRLLVATATGGSALMGTLPVLTVRANLDVTSWSAAGALPPTTVLLVFAGAAAVAAAGAWLAGDRPDHVPASEPAAAIAIAPGEAVVWSGRVSGRLGVVVPALLLVGAAVSAWLVPGEARTLVVVALLVVALALTTLGQVRVTIGPTGVSVGLGVAGLAAAAHADRRRGRRDPHRARAGPHHRGDGRRCCPRGRRPARSPAHPRVGPAGVDRLLRPSRVTRHTAGGGTAGTRRRTGHA